MGVHTFFMSEEELVRQIATMREKGFDDSFARFCAHVFSSYEYPEENLAAARMHALYLRLALESLSSPERRAAIMDGEIRGETTIEDVFLKVTRESFWEALQTGRPFPEQFVERWLSSWSVPSRDDK